MARRFAAAALAIVLLLSTLLGAAVASAASPAQGGRAIHPDALSIRAVNGFGDVTDTFYVGLTWGDIYFRAIDTGADAQGNVTLSDQNYSRDGLPNPVATWTVTFQDHENDSLGSSNYYQLPLTLADAGLWTLNLTAGGTNVSETLYVHTYYAWLDSSSNSYLPGHSGTLYYGASSEASEGPFTSYQNLQLVGEYQTTAGPVLPIPGLPHNLTVASVGNLTFQVPVNASSPGQLFFEVYANQTSGSDVWTEGSESTPYVGNVSGVELAFVDCSGDCPTFQDGTIAVLEIYVDVRLPYGTGVGSDLTAKLTFENNGVPVTAPAGAPTSVTTNGSGYAIVAFEVSSPLFSESHPNSVQVNITDPADPSVNVGDSIPFYVSSTTAPAQLQLLLGQATYYSGDDVTATWTLGGLNDTLPPGWNAGWWEAYSESDQYQIFGEGNSAAGKTTGTFSFAIPSDFTGEFEVVQEAENATTDTFATAEAEVAAPTILVNPSEATYKAGDSFNVNVVTEGQELQSATLYEITTDSNGNVLSSASFTGGSFPVKVPTVSPPQYLEFEVFAQSSTLGVIAQATALSELQSGYDLDVSVQTASSYSDGSYQPGQTVTVSYTLQALGTTLLPPAVALIVVPSPFDSNFENGGNGIPGEFELSSVATSGTFSYTIPANAPNGYNTFAVYAYPLSAGCTIGNGNCATGALLTVDVNSNPPALGLTIGAGTGLTLGWLLLLIIVLVVAILGILWARRRMGGSGGRSRTEPPKAFDPTSTTPPATAPGANAWSEGGPTPPAGGGAPPPPPGSSG